MCWWLLLISPWWLCPMILILCYVLQPVSSGFREGGGRGFLSTLPPSLWRWWPLLLGIVDVCFVTFGGHWILYCEDIFLHDFCQKPVPVFPFHCPHSSERGMTLILVVAYLDSSFPIFQFFRAQFNFSLSLLMSPVLQGLDLGEGLCIGTCLPATSLSSSFHSISGRVICSLVGCRISFFHSSWSPAVSCLGIGCTPPSSSYIFECLGWVWVLGCSRWC